MFFEDCMGLRRKARVYALQFLFQCDLNPPENLDAALEQFWVSRKIAELGLDRKATWGQEPELPPPTDEELQIRSFAEKIIRGVLENKQVIDELISRHLINWPFYRVALVDRNIMRIAVYEMLFCKDIPPAVSIDEAIEIAKEYSTEASGKFVNGVLDKIRLEIMRPAKSVE